MTDKEKLDRLVAEIERLYHQSLVDENRQAELGLSSAACTSYGKSKVCKELLSFIDSMQKEPKECMYSKDNYTDEDRKDLCDGCEEKCKFNKKKEPVSEDLEEAANDAVISLVPSFGQKYSDGSYVSCIRDSFKREELIKLYKAGAEWQKQQMIAKGIDGVVHHFAKCEVASVHYNDPDNVPMAYYIPSEGLSAGDKVKIITIKED